jgi:Major Facilitator Superfamily
MGDDALIPLRIFRLRAAAVVIAAGVIVGAGMFGAITVLPQYMQIVHGSSPTEAGLMMLPMVVGMMSAGIIVGQITSRTGVIRIFPILGSALGAVAMLALSRVGADTGLLWVMAGMLLLGLGLGQCMQPLTIIVQNAVPPTEIGVATSSATFFRQLGGTLGVAIFLSLLFSTLGDNIANAFKSAAPGIHKAATAGHIPKTQLDDQVISGLKGHRHGSGVFASVQNDSSIIGRMSSVLAHPFKVGFADSMSLVLLCGGCFLLAAFAVLLLMPSVELRATSASVAARAERDAGQAGPSAPPLEASTTASDGAHRSAVPVLTSDASREQAVGRHVRARPEGES